MSLVIRSATKNDVISILDIVNHEILYSTSIYDYKPRTYEKQLTWFEQKQKDGMPVIVAEKEGVIIGFGSYGIFRPWDGYRFSVEHSIYVHKDHRNTGAGKAIMEALIQQAKKNGYHTMIAGVDAANEASISFHKQFGFKEAGLFKEVGHKFDQWLDLLFLQLILDK